MTSRTSAPRSPRFPRLPLAPYPTPVEGMARLREALGGGPRLFVKRDDTIAFAFGGNKVRKMRIVLAQAREAGATRSSRRAASNRIIAVSPPRRPSGTA